MRSALVTPFAFAFAAAAAASVASCSENNTTPAAPASTIAEAPVPVEEPAPTAPPAKPAAPPPVDTTTKGCALTPRDAGAMTTRATKAANNARSYHLSVPAAARPKQPLPLVFVLHGAGDTAPENMKDWFGVEGNMPAALVVYPQAMPRTRADGTGGKVPRWDLSGNEDLAFFDTMLAELSDAYCIDRSHVFVTGFSSGGNFSQHLACNRQKDVKGMAVVAGPGPFSDTCGGAVPVWMTHDANDETLPVKDARSSRDFWANENGCTATTWSPVPGRPECKQNTTCAAHEPLVYCETTGIGHDVPEFAAGAIGTFFGDLVK